MLSICSAGARARRTDCTSIGRQSRACRARSILGGGIGEAARATPRARASAASVIDFCASAEAEERVGSISACMLLDPQVLIEGTPPVPAGPLARGGVRLLKSWALRSLGQKIAYEDVQQCDTDDAIRVGRLHCERASSGRTTPCAGCSAADTARSRRSHRSRARRRGSAASCCGGGRTECSHQRRTCRGCAGSSGAVRNSIG